MSFPIKNYSASVHQKLFNYAKNSHRHFNDLLTYFAMERFLYRLSQSKHKDTFVLKGALMFIVWEAPYSRATHDIDVLGRGDNTIPRLIETVREICTTPVPPDGMMYDSQSVVASQSQWESEYVGVRFGFVSRLGNARIPLQMDIGFGDAVFPKPDEIDYPAILDFPKPRLKGYPRETVVAEKLQAMFDLGMLNSRLKDFYDIWLLSVLFSFDGPSLTQAMKGTFDHRKTDFSVEPAPFTKAFYMDKNKQVLWGKFVQKNALDTAPESLEILINALKKFLLPPLQSLVSKVPFNKMWEPNGAWH